MQMHEKATSNHHFIKPPQSYDAIRLAAKSKLHTDLHVRVLRLQMLLDRLKTPEHHLRRLLLTSHELDHRALLILGTIHLLLARLKTHPVASKLELTHGVQYGFIWISCDHLLYICSLYLWYLLIL